MLRPIAPTKGRADAFCRMSTTWPQVVHILEHDGRDRMAHRTGMVEPERLTQQACDPERFAELIARNTGRASRLGCPQSGANSQFSSGVDSGTAPGAATAGWMPQYVPIQL